MASRKKLVSVLNISVADVMNTYVGMDLQLHAFLTSALDASSKVWAFTQLQLHHVPYNVKNTCKLSIFREIK